MTPPSPPHRLPLTPLPDHELTAAELSAGVAVIDCIDRLFIATDRRDWSAVPSPDDFTTVPS